MCHSGPISLRSSSGTLQQANVTQASAIEPTPTPVFTTLYHAAVSGNFVCLTFVYTWAIFFAHSYYPCRKVEERSPRPSLNFEFTYAEPDVAVRYMLRASAWETGADLEMSVGRFRLKLVHNVIMWTYVICQSFSVNDLFLAEFWISAPQWSPEADFQCNLATFQSLF